MPKRDAEKLAREIWQAKDETEALPGVPRQHLPDVTAAFLERRYFAIPRLITEVGAYTYSRRHRHACNSQHMHPSVAHA